MVTGLPFPRVVALARRKARAGLADHEAREAAAATVRLFTVCDRNVIVRGDLLTVPVRTTLRNLSGQVIQ
jgi:hypothetical protein